MAWIPDADHVSKYDKEWLVNVKFENHYDDFKNFTSFWMARTLRSNTFLVLKEELHTAQKKVARHAEMVTLPMIAECLADA